MGYDRETVQSKMLTSSNCPFLFIAQASRLNVCLRVVDIDKILHIFSDQAGHDGALRQPVE